MATYVNFVWSDKYLTRELILITVHIIGKFMKQELPYEQCSIWPARKALECLVFKGSGHYWKLLKIIIRKPVLVMSNGERLVV